MGVGSLLIFFTSPGLMELSNLQLISMRLLQIQNKHTMLQEINRYLGFTEICLDDFLWTSTRPFNIHILTYDTVFFFREYCAQTVFFCRKEPRGGTNQLDNVCRQCREQQKLRNTRNTHSTESQPLLVQPLLRQGRPLEPPPTHPHSSTVVPSSTHSTVVPSSAPVHHPLVQPLLRQGTPLV